MRLAVPRMRRLFRDRDRGWTRWRRFEDGRRRSAQQQQRRDASPMPGASLREAGSLASHAEVKFSDPFADKKFSANLRLRGRASFARCGPAHGSFPAAGPCLSIFDHQRDRATPAGVSSIDRKRRFEPSLDIYHRHTSRRPENASPWFRSDGEFVDASEREISGELMRNDMTGRNVDVCRVRLRKSQSRLLLKYKMVW